FRVGWLRGRREFEVCILPLEAPARQVRAFARSRLISDPETAPGLAACSIHSQSPVWMGRGKVTQSFPAQPPCGIGVLSRCESGRKGAAARFLELRRSHLHPEARAEPPGSRWWTVSSTS